MGIISAWKRLSRKRQACVPKDRRHYLSIVAIVKNEAQYIDEWVDFHRLVGVEHFYIYDNGSTDGTPDILHSFEGVTVTFWPQQADSQRDAYDHAVREFGFESRWMLFIDIDEFAFPAYCWSLPEVLREYEDLPGLVLPWRMFGFSGHRRKPSGLVIENYVRLCQLPNPDIPDGIQRKLMKVKSLVDPTRVVDVHAHLFTLDSGPPFTLSRELGHKHLPPASGPILLNHYFTKSEAEFDLKYARGHVGRPSRGTVKTANKDAMAGALQINTVEDRSIQRFVPSLKQLMTATGKC